MFIQLKFMYLFIYLFTVTFIEISSHINAVQ